jgi:hypothetical protein
MMPTDPVISSVLTQLSRIARAPMTPAERELRARSLLGDLAPETVAAATATGETEWNRRQASDQGIDAEMWLQAVHIAGLPNSDSLSTLIDRLHRAEAAAEILKAGYRPGQGAGGILAWSPR